MSRPPAHSRWKRRALIALTALFVIGIPVAIVWTMIDIQRCYDNGGIYVAPFKRGQHCAMPTTEQGPAVEGQESDA